MRKTTIFGLTGLFLVMLWVSHTQPYIPTHAQDRPLLTTTPSHTPIITPLALQNPDFEIDLDGDAQPDGWATNGLKKRDRVRYLRGMVRSFSACMCLC